MSLKKSLTIKNKIFTKSDIQHLWDKISENGETKLTLEFAVGTEYSAKNDKNLQDGEIIDQKKCEKILICHKNDKKEFIYLNLDTNSSSLFNLCSGSIKIETEDETAGLGKLEIIKNKINSIQSNKHSFIQNPITDLLLFFLFIFLLLFILTSLYELLKIITTTNQGLNIIFILLYFSFVTTFCYTQTHINFDIQTNENPKNSHRLFETPPLGEF